MSRILVLGNGFDIAHGLPTSYKEFLYVCANSIGLKYDFDFSEKKIKRMKPILDNFNIAYKEYFNVIRRNSWLKYFYSVSHEIDGKWVDFEHEIKKVCEICNSKKFGEPIYFGHKMFESDTVKGEYDVNKMKTHLTDLIEIFNKYLLILSYDSIGKYYSEIINFDPTYVISFNYTDTYNRLYCENQIVDYVHGKVSNQCNTMVLGFDSMSDERSDAKFGEFLKYFQMVEKDIELDSYLEIQQTKPELKKNNKAMFFGHSLDKTDIDIIKTIIDSVGQVLLYYHDSEHKNQMMKNLIKIYGRKGFINLTLSKNKKVFFIKQTNGRDLNDENREFIKNLLFSLDNLDFENCSVEELKSLINNSHIKLGYNNLQTLLINLYSQQDRITENSFPNFLNIKDFLENEIEKIINRKKHLDE